MKGWTNVLWKKTSQICSIKFVVLTAEINGKKSKEKDTTTKKIKPIKGKKPDHNQWHNKISLVFLAVQLSTLDHCLRDKLIQPRLITDCSLLDFWHECPWGLMRLDLHSWLKSQWAGMFTFFNSKVIRLPFNSHSLMQEDLIATKHKADKETLKKIEKKLYYTQNRKE